MKYRNICILLSLFCINSILAAEESTLDLSKYQIRHWDIYSGLCSDSITAVYQDSKGFVWIGTFDGVMRYDGQTFMTFDQTNTPGFIGHSANAFFEINDQLFILSGQGIIRYSEGCFKSYTEKDGLVSNNVSAMTVDRNGTIWVGTNQGLMYFDGLRFHLPEYGGVDPFIGRAISALVYHPEMSLTVACSDGGLYAYADSRPILIQDTEVAQIASMIINENSIIAGDRNGNLYIAESVDNITVRQVSGIPIRDICAADDYLWIITSSEIIKYDGAILLRFSSDKNSPGVPGSVPKVIEIDGANNIWIGTRSNGLYLLYPSGFKNYGQQYGLPENTVNSVSEFPENQYWIGTDFGLYCLNNQEFVQNDLTRYLGGERIKHLQAVNGKLYISTLSGKGVVIWDGRNISQINQQDGLPHKVVKKTMMDSRGTLWISTSSGVATISAEGEWIIYNKANGFISDEIYDLFEDSYGRIWISTVYDGLIRMEQNGAYQRFSEREGLIGEMVFSVREDIQGDCWVSTSSGVFLIRRDDSIHPLYFEQGLPYLYVYTVEPVNDRLYFTSVKGFSVAPLSVVKETVLGDCANFEIEHYNWNSGLSASPNSLSWLFMDSKEQIWIPTHRGADCFIPDVALDNKSIFTPFVKQASTTKEKILDPELLEFQGVVDYLALSCCLPGFTGRHSLEYRLYPYQDFWTPLPDSGAAIYTKLNPGKYVFQLKNTLNEQGPAGQVELPIQVKYSLPGNPFLLFLLLPLAVVLYILFRYKQARITEPDLPGIMNKYKLTEREMEILTLLFSGKRDKEIAQAAGCAISTVSNTLSRIYKKTNTGGRSDLMLLVHHKVKKSTVKVRKP